MTAFPDQETLSRIAQGDEVAFDQLCAYFERSAFRFCKDILKDEAEAQCIIKDVFAMIWEERLQLLFTENFQSYLFLKLRNQIFEQMKNYTDAGSRTKYLEKIHALATPESRL